jgi:CheY-like chemotaxis protein
MVGELNDEQRKQLNMVYGSAKHLLGLIDNILDLSKIESGKSEISPYRFELSELIQLVEKMVTPMIEEKGLKLGVAVSDGTPSAIYSDKDRIKQVLINLLSNAIKFTESGRIELMVRPSMLDPGASPEEFEKEELSGIKADQAASLVFSVSDTGVGIKEENLADVFDEFKQIEGPLKIKPDGTGLGLAISRKMVEIMGGRMWAESECGKGSCFHFTLPVGETPESKRPSAVSPERLDRSKRLVLTVDDEVESQEILKSYLTLEGYEVMQAYSAPQAMELAREHHPFAITLDIIMPGRDGWDILDTLKKDPETTDIPVICISILDNRELGLSLGAFEYLVKPIDKDRLMEELRRLEKRFRIYDILVVDDEPQDVELLAKYLSEENSYEVRKAYGGAEGLGMVEQRRPDLIILDLMMPEVDGFEVIGRLKESEGSRDIPIIVVTAKDLAKEEAEYLNKNIEKIIRKGEFSKEDLFKDIKRALEKIEAL